MNLLSGGRAPNSRTPPVAQGLGIRTQTSLNGVAIAVVLGTTRVSGNLLWYGDFVAKPMAGAGGKSGGKGGMVGGAAAKGQVSSGTDYNASFAVGLCVGPIQGLGLAWATNSTPVTPPDLGGSMAIMDGALGQAGWSYLAAAHPDQFVAYSGLAHVGFAAMDLSGTPNLPNLTFEVLGLGPAALAWPWTPLAGTAAWSTEYVPPSYASAPFAAVASVLKTPAVTSDIVFDSSPAFCVAALLTDTQWGCALAPSLVGDLTSYATWCQAEGIAISAALVNQRAARDVLQQWLTATLSDVYWSEGLIKVGSYADAAVTGSAADGSALTYTPNLAPAMTIDDSVMLPAGTDQGPLLVTRKDPAEIYNQVTVEYWSRAAGYNTMTVQAQDDAHIAAFGLRPAPTVQADFITQGGIAQKVADLILARSVGVQATYEWDMKSPGELLEPFDVVALTDPGMGLSAYPVRVLKVEEKGDTAYHVTAEDIPGVIGAMAARPLAANAGFVAAHATDPGGVNAPVIFEPPDALVTSKGGLEVWLAVSGAEPLLWGGCQIHVSTDGQTYGLLATVEAPARQGVLTAALAAVAAAPSGPTIDQTNVLEVDLGESNGTLLGTDQAGALALNTLAYVDGEMIAYATANLAVGHTYDLAWLVRGAYHTTISAHPAGAPFARLDGAIVRWPFAADRVGQTIYFKFCSFNGYGGGLQGLDQVQPYAYTLRGTALSAPPPDVAGLATAYQGGITQLAWDSVSDFRAVDYEIRMGAAGATWETARVVGRTPLTHAPTQGDGTYFVAAHYRVPNGADVYSAAPAEIVVAGSQLTSNIVASFDEAAAGWSGTLSDTLVIGGELWLSPVGDMLTATDVTGIPDVIFYGGVAASGSYQIPAAHRVDIGRVAACNVIVGLGALLGYSGSTLDVRGMPDVTAVADILGLGLGAYASATPQIRLSQDGATWGAWQNWAPGAYTARAFDCRVLLGTLDTAIAAAITDLTFAVDVPDRTDTGTGVAVAAGGTAVTFASAFNGGPGGAPVPNVQITVLGAGAGDTVALTAVAKTGFTVQVLNGGTGVARNVNWIAQGY